MVAVFLIVVGTVIGGVLMLIGRQWLKGCEAREKARIAREQKNDV